MPEDQEKQFTGKLEGRLSTVEDFANVIETIGKVKHVINNTEYINESLAEVLDTFKEALMLVIIIVLIFLQSWRATLIPVLAIPVSPWHFWTR